MDVLLLGREVHERCYAGVAVRLCGCEGGGYFVLGGFFVFVIVVEGEQVVRQCRGVFDGAVSALSEDRVELYVCNVALVNACMHACMFLCFLVMEK